MDTRKISQNVYGNISQIEKRNPEQKGILLGLSPYLISNYYRAIVMKITRY